MPGPWILVASNFTWNLSRIGILRRPFVKENTILFWLKSLMKTSLNLYEEFWWKTNCTISSIGGLESRMKESTEYGLVTNPKRKLRTLTTYGSLDNLMILPMMMATLWSLIQQHCLIGTTIPRPTCGVPFANFSPNKNCHSLEVTFGGSVLFV